MSDFESECVSHIDDVSDDSFTCENEIFNFNQNTLANARLLIDDENDEDWNEMEHLNFENESIPAIQDVVDIEIEESTSISNLTSCVILDIIQGKITRCNSVEKLRPLKQMIGTWEIDVGDNDKSKLGICSYHFLFDQNQLHKSNAKQFCPIGKSMIHFHFCIFCNKKKCFFSRGNGCKEHSWSINEHNVQIPCIGIFKCPALNEGLIAKKIPSGYRAHYVCSECFQQQGGHLYERPGRSKKYLPCNSKSIIKSSDHFSRLVERQS